MQIGGVWFCFVLFCVTVRSVGVGGCWPWFRCLARNLLGLFLPSSLAPACVGCFDLMTIRWPHDHEAAVTLQTEHPCARQEIKGWDIKSKAPPSVRKQHILPRSPQHSPLHLIGQNCHMADSNGLGIWESKYVVFLVSDVEVSKEEGGWEWLLDYPPTVCVANNWLICFHSSLVDHFLMPFGWILTLVLLLLLSFWL